jgi:hypothetical protein
MRAGVSGDGKALRGFLVGRPLDGSGNKLRIWGKSAEAFGLNENQ